MLRMSDDIRDLGYVYNGNNAFIYPYEKDYVVLFAKNTFWICHNTLDYAVGIPRLTLTGLTTFCDVPYLGYEPTLAHPTPGSQLGTGLKEGLAIPSKSHEKAKK